MAEQFLHHEQMQEHSPEPIPLELASQFVSGDVYEGKPIIHEGDKTITYRCFERDEVLPGIENAKLHLDYRLRTELSSERDDQLRFEYEQGNKLIAEMHFGIMDKNTFVLEHRYVHSEFGRNQGLGTRLLQEAEQWVQHVADAAQHDMVIELHTGQKDVMSWGEKNDYEIDPQYTEQLNEIETHSEHFVLDDIIGKDGIRKERYIFRKDVPGRTVYDAVRLVFKKHIKFVEEVINP